MVEAVVCAHVGVDAADKLFYPVYLFEVAL